MEPSEVYFDFACRFASRPHVWLAKLDVGADWLRFSLLEAQRDGDGPPVWEGPAQADNISLLMLAGHELVRDGGGDTARYRRRMFAAWHGSNQRLDADRVLGHAEDAGVDADVDDLHGATALVGDQHRSAVDQGVFGSSAIVFGSGRGTFVRFTDAPDVEAGPAVLAALRTAAEDAPGLDHLEPLRD